MTDPILIAIEKERVVLRARLEALDEMEKKVKRTPRPNGVIVQPHAPSGLLRESIVESLEKHRAPIMSADLKRLLRGNGYSHPINGQYFTKTLRALVTEKVVAKKPNGAYSTYQLLRRR